MRRRLFALALLTALALPAAADEVLRLPGMRIGGTVTRDVRGIPHITGFTEWDAHFLTGYAQAQDRLFQMDYSRRLASGTLAELVGPAALSSDVQLRAIGLRRTASSAMNIISKEAREALEAYALGVNAWALSHPLPPEYAALEITKFEPWAALDSLAFANLFLLGQFFDDSDAARTVTLLTYQGTGAAAGFDGTKLFFEDLARFEPFDHTTTLPPSAVAGRSAGVVVARPSSFLSQVEAEGRRLAALGVEGLVADWLAKVEAAPYFKEALNRERDHGSNEWGVSGKLSASGNPMIANDPHLSLGWPSTWYPMAVKGGPIDATGMGAAGVPFVLVGQTPRVAWGATNNPTDVTDIYVEQVVPDPGSVTGFATIYKGQKESVVAIPEVFRQNNPGNGTNDDITVVPATGAIPPATLIVLRRNFGPIISLDLAHGSALSLQYAGTAATREIDGFRTWNTARSLDDFRRGLTFLTVGSFNWAVADADGNLAYLTSGELPLREDLQANAPKGLPPYFLRDGTGGNEWMPRQNVYPNQALLYEILPPSERPQSVNPAAGWFVNANNDPIGVTLGNNPLGRQRPGGGILYLNYGYDGFRCARITQVIQKKLAGGGKISFDDMKAIQADNVLLDAQVFVPFLLAAWDHANGSQQPALAGIASNPFVTEGVKRLRSWDDSTPTGLTEGWDAGKPSGTAPTQAQIDASVAATVYSVWRGRFAANVIDRTIAPFKLSPPGSDHNSTLPALRHLLENFSAQQGVGASGLNFFNHENLSQRLGFTSAADARDYVLLEALSDAGALLQSDGFAPAFNKSSNFGDYRWGKLHRITFAHPLGSPFSVPPGNGAFPAPLAGLPGIPRSGGIGTPDVGNHPVRASTVNGFTFGSGPSRRYVGEVGPTSIRAETSLPGGVSALPTSPYYINLLPLWLTNATYPAELSVGPTLPWAP
jgi:penicillin G amidase